MKSTWVEDISAPNIVSLEKNVANHEKAIGEFLEKYAGFEERLRNMANKLEEHINTPDSHNPGIMSKK